MSCKHGFYKSTEHNQPKLYCDITNNMCIYSKLCLKTGVNKYVFTDNAFECKIKDKAQEIPEDACLIRFIKNGYVYAELEDKVIKVLCDNIADLEKYIYVRKKENGTYVGSPTPFVVVTKKNNKRERKRVEKSNEKKNN